MSDIENKNVKGRDWTFIVYQRALLRLGERF